MDDLDFSSLALIQIPVTAPDGAKFNLVRADGEVTARWEDAQLASRSYDKDGNFVKFNGVHANTRCLLVAGCLRDQEGKPVGEDVVRRWPGTMVQRLYDKAMWISELADDDPKRLRSRIDALTEQLKEVESREAVLKNGRSATAGGSA